MHLLLAIKLVKNSALQLCGVLAANPRVLRYRAPSNQRLDHGTLRQFNSLVQLLLTLIETKCSSIE